MPLSIRGIPLAAGVRVHHERKIGRGRHSREQCGQIGGLGLAREIPAADASGKRAILHEETYGNRQASEPSLKPISAYRLVARALQVSVGKTLMGLDSSNCSRSQVPVSVPLDVAVPAK